MASPSLQSGLFLDALCHIEIVLMIDQTITQLYARRRP
jgi:hypothetical protein